MKATALMAACVVSLLAAVACAEPPAAPIPADFQVSIGSGGGVVGTWRTTRLRPDGSLVVEFSTAGHVDSEVPAGRLDEARRREAWTLLKAANLGTLGCEPGNMTEEIELRADGALLRACAPMGQGSPEFRRIHGEIERLIGAPAAGVGPPPPPLPPMPPVLVIEVDNTAGSFRVARAGGPLPKVLAQGAIRVPDETMQPLWEMLLSGKFYSGASIEQTNGTPLPGAPYGCWADTAVRVTTGDGSAWETRHRCVEGDEAIRALADAVVRAAGP
jgi:hypothetical protein